MRQEKEYAEHDKQYELERMAEYSHHERDDDLYPFIRNRDEWMG